MALQSLYLLDSSAFHKSDLPAEVTDHSLDGILQNDFQINYVKLLPTEYTSHMVNNFIVKLKISKRLN